MDEKKIEEMMELGNKKNLTPEERAQYKVLFKEYMEKKMKGFYPHGTPRKDSDR